LVEIREGRSKTMSVFKWNPSYTQISCSTLMPFYDGKNKNTWSELL
jgi:hypothetical protein